MKAFGLLVKISTGWINKWTVHSWENKETHAVLSEVEFVKKNRKYIFYIKYSVEASNHTGKFHNAIEAKLHIYS